jgi:hypothetical protein
MNEPPVTSTEMDSGDPGEDSRHSVAQLSVKCGDAAPEKMQGVRFV